MPYKDRGRQAEYQRLWHLARREERGSRTRERRKELRDFIRATKESSGCQDCGKSYPYYVLQFDHRPGETKVFGIGSTYAIPSMKVLLKEMAKCDIVCANCHAERTHQRRITGTEDVAVLRLP